MGIVEQGGSGNGGWDRVGVCERHPEVGEVGSIMCAYKDLPKYLFIRYYDAE